MEVDSPKRVRDLPFEDLPQRATLRIDSSDDLALVEPEGDRVIGLPFTRRPRGSLSGHDLGEALHVSHHVDVDRFVEREQPRLMCE